MDNFEKHIRENKNIFDEHKADKAKLWANIESHLDEPDTKPKVIKLWKSTILKVAASIVIILGVSVFINSYKTNDNQLDNIANQELNDIDTYYNGLVSYQVKLVNKNTILTAEEKKEFLLFMDELDEEYEVLKLELQKNLDAEYVLAAIVTNYKKRIELIENLLEQINSSEETNENHEYIL